jgi:hypothetical protein
MPKEAYEKLSLFQNGAAENVALMTGDEAQVGQDKSGSAFLLEFAARAKRFGFTPNEYAHIAYSWPVISLHEKPDPIRQIVRAWNRCGVVNADEEFEPVELAPNENPTTAKVTPRKRFTPFTAFEGATTALGSSSKPLVKGILSLGDTAFLFGPPGVGKTFVALDIAHAVATGRPWQGRKVTKGLVIYASLEGQGGIKLRLRALRAKYPYDSNTPFEVIPNPINFRDAKTDIPALIAEIRLLSDKWGTNPSLLVIDTVARALQGGNENSSEDAGSFIGAIDVIRATFGCTVLAVHHPSKGNEEALRGFSGLEGAADWVYRINRNKEVTCLKVKDGELPDRMKYKLAREVLGQDEDGDEITSCTVHWLSASDAEFGPEPPEGEKGKPSADDKLLDYYGVLETIYADNGGAAVSADQWMASYVDWAKANGGAVVRETTMRNWRQSLRAKGMVSLNEGNWAPTETEN